MIEILPVDKLSPDPDNPRRGVGDVGELAASIAAVGILEPLIVTPGPGGGYLIVAGARRFAAAKKARLAEVPAIVKDLDERARAEIMLIENLQREDLAPLEEAGAYRRLLGLGYSQIQLAERIGRSQSHVSKRLALLELPAEARKALYSGGISVGEATELTRLKDPKRIRAVLNRPSYHSVEQELRTQLGAQKDEQERARKVAALEKAGIRVLSSQQRAAKEGAVALHAGWGKLAHVDPAAHRKEPCHAVVVGRWGEDEFCTDPARHPAPPKAPTAPARRETKREREFRLHREALAAALVDRRGSFLPTLVASRLRKADVVELFELALLCGDAYGDGTLAAEILEIPVEENYDVDRDHIVAFAESGPAARSKAALAWALSVLESSYAPPKAYIELLRRCGYAVSPAEERELAGKAPA